jgi:hypothetical protein
MFVGYQDIIKAKKRLRHAPEPLLFSPCSSSFYSSVYTTNSSGIAA